MTGFEPLIGAAAAGLGGLITNLVKDKGTETLKKIDWDIGKNLAVKKALVDYVRRYIDRHGTLKVACVRMDYPVRLDEIYTAVQLLDRSALRYFESEDALQEQYRESGKRGFNVTRAEKKPGLQVANEQQYLMVLGGPGVGKSTFLRKVGLEALRTLGRRDFAGKDPGNLLVPQQIFYEHPCIPVMLELRQFDKANASIQGAIAAELDTCGFPHPEELTELFLKNGKLLVLLDGLDEVPSATLNHAITEIENLVDRHSDNRYIASCRVAAYTFGGFRRFKDVAMATFEDEQIEQFIKNWFQKERDTETNTAEHCWELLNSSDYQAAKELAQPPLLLTLLCVVYDEFQDFPKKRHALYGEALDVLLRKWASEKRIQRNPIYQELSAELELDMLAEIAYTSFADDQLFFAKERPVQQIRKFLVGNLNAPSHLDAETILKEIEIQQGILVERARNTYSFSHLTFQEYLAAKFITDNQKINQLVREHAIEQRWQEVLLLAAGLVTGEEGANSFLSSLEFQAQSCLKKERITAFMAWTEDITKNFSEDLILLPAKRASAAFIMLSLIIGKHKVFDFSLSLAFDLIQSSKLDFEIHHNSRIAVALTYDLEQILNLIKSSEESEGRVSSRIYRDLDVDIEFAIKRALNRAIELAEEYAKTNIIPQKNTDQLLARILDIRNRADKIKSYGDSKIIIHEIRNSFIESLNIDPRILDLEFEDKVLLANYFYILGLMIRCKEAARRVSPQVWAGIESRMVTVPD